MKNTSRATPMRRLFWWLACRLLGHDLRIIIHPDYKYALECRRCGGAWGTNKVMEAPGRFQ